jgi:hypothetical protein
MQARIADFKLQISDWEEAYPGGGCHVRIAANVAIGTI